MKNDRIHFTIAKDYVLITNSKYRFTYGQMNDQRPSRFLHDLPSHLIKSEDASFWQRPQFTSYFNQWFNFSSIQSNIQTKSEHLRKDTKQTNASAWKKHQPVKHNSYGIGVIEDVDKKPHATYITVRFSSTTKKLSEHFVEPI